MSYLPPPIDEVIVSDESNSLLRPQEKEDCQYAPQDLLAELTNEGASQIENGLFQEAISVLTMAVNLATSRYSEDSPLHLPMNSVLDADAEGSVISQSSHSQRSHRQKKARQEKKATSRRRREQETHSTTPTRNVLSLGTSMASLQLESRQRRCTEDIAVGRKRLHFVYAKPIRVLDRFHPPSVSELALYVVYNLALAYQQKALAQNKKRSNSWKRAARWYSLALAMQDEEATIGMSPTYTIALWNNLAECYWQMGQDEQSDQCFQNVISNLVCMMDYECIREVEQIDAFLDNSGHLLNPQHDTTATAA